MSLSIDYITMPPKSQEVSQIQQSEQTKYQQANQELASQFQEQVKQGSEQTIRRAKPENKEFRYEEEKRREGKKKQSSNRRNQGKQQQEDKKEATYEDGHSFDIRI